MGLSDYKIVEYVKNVSPYQQIILTDIVPLSTDRIDVRMKFGVDSSGTDNQPLFGACEVVSGSWKARYCSYFTCSNRSIAFYNHFTWHTDISANYILNASETGNSSTNAQQALSMGLTQGSWGSQAANYSSEYNSSFSELSIPIAFFGVNWSGELRPTINKEIYIYGANIFNSSNECIHSLLPVERISDNALGLYDTITDKFYSNSGSGSLAKGDYTGVWLIDEGGDITNANFIDLPPAMSQPYPDALWRIESGYNEGRPFNMLLPDISNIVPWVQPSEPVIHVYSSRDTEFTTNGYAILEPISCEVHHEENGVYEATLETYCDEYNKFTYVKKQALIRIPLKYHGETNHQIFRIRECTRRMDEQGNYRIVATAQHKFYDLTRYMIEDCRPTSLDGDAALTWLFTHGWYGNETDEEFTYSSDITNSRTAYYQNMNVVNALLGADQCFVNRWGGKLFRDNTYFSLNTTMENARDAGVICYGYNMTEIELVENDADLITVLIAEDNYGNKYTLTNEDVPTEAIPHHIYGYARFTYDAEDVDAFHADAQAYFDEHKQSSLNLTVRFANLSDIDLYKDFLALDDYEVGDHITVYHKDLDIFYANLEIISKTFDVVSQKTSEIQIGSLRSAITSRPFMSQTVSSGNSVEDKQYISLDDQLDEVAFFAVVQYPISTEDDELLVTSDGKYLQYKP